MPQEERERASASSLQLAALVSNVNKFWEALSSRHPTWETLAGEQQHRRGPSLRASSSALHPHQRRLQPQPACERWMRMFLGHHPTPAVGKSTAICSF